MPAPVSRGAPYDPVFFTAVSVATTGNGNVSWTTVDVSAYVPAGIRLVVLTVSLAGGTSNGSFQLNQVDFRKDSSSATAATVATKSANNGATTDLAGFIQTVYVPITAARGFDYQKTDTTNQGSSGATISLLGYL